MAVGCCRRAKRTMRLIESYQVGNDVYMLLTTSNAVKFEQKGSKERETVDNIVNSFKIGQGAFS